MSDGFAAAAPETAAVPAAVPMGGNMVAGCPLLMVVMAVAAAAAAQARSPVGMLVPTAAVTAEVTAASYLSDMIVSRMSLIAASG